MMPLSPIVLFVYNRPDHTRQTLEALSANELADQSTLYIFSDGPQYGALEEDLAQVEAVRDVLRLQQWCKEVAIVESEYNKGLADSIVSGITEVVNRHGRVIVLEDDIVTRKGFLRYMNEALEMYADDDRVMHVSGMIYGTPRSGGGEGTSFLRILSCHGWATWKRAWDHYCHDVQELQARLRAQHISPSQFDIEGGAHFYKQLQANLRGDLYTWAVRWYASWLTAGGYALFPHRSLVTNTGHDGTGVHSGASFYNGETVDQVEVTKQPVEENLELRLEVDAIWREGRGLRNEQRRPPSFAQLKGWLGRRLYAVFRKAIRGLVDTAYPELAGLDDQVAKRCGLLSSAHNCHIAPKARLIPPYHFNSSTVGDFTYVMPHSWVSEVTVGRFCSIGPRFTAGSGIHPLSGISTSPMFYSTKKQNGTTLSKIDKVVERKRITIGNDVFIGMNVTVLDGVTIADGAVIGAGCVVSKDVPAYAIVVGNPMRILRYRFPERTREQLLAIKWWELPEDRLSEVERHFFQVQAFIDRYTDSQLSE
jgi:acetyltransferase-like isoleucine patch superfamily enzyme